MTNHLDVVVRVKAGEPPDTFTSTDKMLGFVLRVITQLPPEEKVGLVKGPPGGENIARYAPTGDFVRVNRVAYPDGTLIKILTDSGPGGVNGPAWNFDDMRPDLYLSINSTPVPNPTPAPPPQDNTEVLNKLAELFSKIDNLVTLNSNLTVQVSDVAGQIHELQNEVQSLIDNPVVFPVYEGRVFGATVRLTPRK